MPNIRILLDNNVPVQVVPLLRPHDVVWAAISNGDLIRAAQKAGFAALITCDQNIQYQQRLESLPLAFFMLTTTHWPTIRDNLFLLADAIGETDPGGYVTIAMPRPPRVRRPYPPPA